MRYLKEQPFITVMKGPFALRGGLKSDANGSTDEATVSELLYWLLSSYRPQPPNKILGMQDLRRLNRAIDVLESPPDKNGFYAFESEDFELMRRVAPQVAMISTPRNAPLIDDLLEQAPNEMPN